MKQKNNNENISKDRKKYIRKIKIRKQYLNEYNYRLEWVKQYKWRTI